MIYIFEAALSIAAILYNTSFYFKFIKWRITMLNKTAMSAEQCKEVRGGWGSGWGGGAIGGAIGGALGALAGVPGAAVGALVGSVAGVVVEKSVS
ncbi:hypothetical protein D0N50_13285 [Erwinia billingiae]|uniref:hypothetical protein n=2 Tax=Erwinia billingiae TaxID=182337 RepID=UPI001248962A|nr:hypothetical protein [Erwinia billingiae]QEW32590.1 hypothetical protein D0N50_13285 [Erwinia billingiae]